MKIGVFVLLFTGSMVWAADALGPQAACVKALRPPSPHKQLLRQNLEEARSVFQRLGLTQLLQQLDQSKIRFSRKEMLWESDVAIQISWSNEKYLILRELDFSTGAKKEMALWRLAEALFKLQAVDAKFSSKAMWPISKPVPAEGLWGRISQWMNTPHAWREDKVAELQELRSELFLLLKSLTTVQATELMPAYSPSSSWLKTLLWDQHPAVEAGPSVQDFTEWKLFGETHARESFAERHSQSILFNYYYDYLRRLSILFAVTSMALFPENIVDDGKLVMGLLQLPEFNYALDHAEERAQVLRRAFAEKKKQELREELARLESEYLTLVSDQPQDPKALQSNRRQWQALVDSHPWLRP